MCWKGGGRGGGGGLTVIIGDTFHRGTPDPSGSGTLSHCFRV